MIVNSVHLTQQLWVAGGMSAFRLSRFAIKRGARRGWSSLQHGLAGWAVGVFVLGSMLFAAWRLTPSAAEVHEARGSGNCDARR